MPRRIAQSTLNASTMDILNVIRKNASLEYQELVPEVTKATDIPKVGEVLYGYPALANQFINALVNRIALVKVKSMTFNNPYANLKKGYLEYGETVEEVFVNIAKAREFNVEKAPQRELKRTVPDVRSAFHTMNYRVQYPVTIQDEDLRTAFLSMEGVQDLISKIVDSVYKAAEYDEYLMFKYLIIKAVAHGKMKPLGVDLSDMNNAAISFRATANQLTFPSREYNASGVLTNTDKADQYIFMDSTFNAQYDVSVLAAAFNMDKADFTAKLNLIDDFTSFDNERFDVIRENSDMIEEVTADELALMADVKAVLVDQEWFQVYDNNTKFTENYVGSGMYWNYWLNVWKTISSSPFSNAVVFVDSRTADISEPATISFTVSDKDTSGDVTVISLIADDKATLADSTYHFVQTREATQAGVAVQKYGTVMFSGADKTYTPKIVVGKTTYTGDAAITPATTVGTKVTFSK